MPFSENQRGVIHLGIFGVLFLVGALFVGTKLVTNSDLTFFNTATDAKEVDKANCVGVRNGYEFRWNRKTESCKKKEQSSVLKRLQKRNAANPKGTPQSLVECKGGLYCKSKQLGGSSACLSQGATLYCCPAGERDWGNGKCQALGKCETASCGERAITGASLCQDSAHPNGWYCCPKGKHFLPSINACSSLVGGPPVCPTSECSSSQVAGSSLCVTAAKPDGQYCCPAGKKLVSGACQ